MLGQKIGLNINTILTLVLYAVIGLMWFSTVGAHVNDPSKHTNYLERTEQAVQLAKLTDAVDRLEVAVDKLEEK